MRCGYSPCTTQSLHDAQCVVASLLNTNMLLVPGGGASEMAMSLHLEQYARTISDRRQATFRMFASALLSIPSALASNAGLRAWHVIANLKQAQTLQQCCWCVVVRAREAPQPVTDSSHSSHLHEGSESISSRVPSRTWLVMAQSSRCM